VLPSGSPSAFESVLSRIADALEKLEQSALEHAIATYVFPTLSLAAAVLVPLLILRISNERARADADRASAEARKTTLEAVERQIASQEKVARLSRQREVAARLLAASAQYAGAKNSQEAFKLISPLRDNIAELRLELTADDVQFDRYLSSVDDTAIALLRGWNRRLPMMDALIELKSDLAAAVRIKYQQDLDDETFGPLVRERDPYALLPQGPARSR
jgi:hypothetical protein